MNNALENLKDNNTLRWLEGLPPGYFAVAMASGILSIAFDMIGQTLLAEGLFMAALLTWVIMLGLSAWRLWRFPQAVKIDLLNIRRVFAFFTLVVSTNVVGILLHQHGYPQLALACWAFAFVVWSLLLYLSFSVLTFLTHPHTVNVVHGDWLTSIIATQSLVLLGVMVAP
ncbi:MAG: hypothetical protein QJT81_09590 [Candidatus Thiothrix putei]|uniref:Tellurite resistance protein n=1 Tax=Candidatus Thiothrix putei TaxID=3080811 RepID=A0AA95HJW7_9GAMM|nr:MAG: hypothetical protein QJT81_09590 [Candidatus Thiothrix putei]